MAENYRVKVKQGDREYEVESTSKEYVNAKLKELLSQTDFKIPKSNQVQKRKQRKNAGADTGTNNQNSEAIDIAGVVNFIKDDDQFNDIESNVLDKQNRLPRILMCMYYAAKFQDDAFLTTGQVEKITDQLGVKIKKSNVGSSIKENLKYFHSKNTRKQGQVVYYKLSRNGEKEFERILQGDTI
jgi:hypothetical protein